MAPEQMDPGAKLDVRADVYALGTIAYHLLGGRPPFTGDLTQLIMQKMMQSAPPLRSLRTDISAEFERAIMHALERDPAARPSSPMEWIDEVHAATAHAKPISEGESRVVVMAPQGAEVYVDDERHGSIGRSGRIILNSIAPGRHVLRVARSGEAEDEREIEIRPDASEQIIQAQLRPQQPLGQSRSTPSGVAPSSSQFAYSCSACGTSYPVGIKFCGRCGGKSFRPFSPQPAAGSGSAHGQSQAGMLSCSRCGLVNPPGTRFCGKCGAPVTPVSGFGAANPVQRVCPRCQTSSPPAARFCGKCGLPFG
jgi:serine/threonine protein kinase